MMLLIAQSLQQNEIEQYTLSSYIFPMGMLFVGIVYWIIKEWFGPDPRDTNAEEQRFAGDDFVENAPLNDQ